ncbi:DUF4129 domain-containing protein [Candidatus Cyanaurora vandensis]|uniref:DUF4129 domain-containing protein n=1 Tax=Candidatus Cyanaurora vandensis TaxID=2714958 RepID=UPI00257C399B|nr:DUF4129 domain-containing protein [Candidatus Cyanaurora vandensis]
MPKVEPLLEELRRSGQFRLAETNLDLGGLSLSAQAANIVLWVGLGLGVLWVVLSGVQLWQVFGPHKVSPATALAPSPITPWQQWTAQAEQLTQSGDYRGACRAWYLSLVLWLDSEQQVKYQPTRTNQEYLQDLQDQPRLREPLSQLVRIHERLWYGNQPGQAKDAQSCAQAVAQARQAP